MKSIHIDIQYTKNDPRGEETLSSIVDEVKKLASDRGIKIAKKIWYGGNSMDLNYIDYYRNTTKELIEEVLKKRNLSYRILTN